MRALGLVFVLVIASYVVGCGSGGQQGPAADGKGGGKSIGEDIKKFQEQMKADAKAKKAAQRGNTPR